MSTFSYTAMEKAIVAHVQANLGGGSGTVPIFYPNAAETAPGASEERPATYVELHILHGTPRQADTGNSAPRIRRPGVIQIGVFTAIGKGTKRSTELVDMIVGFMRRATISGTGGTIVCENAGPLPGVREGAYWRVDVDSRFYSDDFDS